MGLADLGFKVLMVDLDSQCNLTGLVLGYSAVNEDDMDTFYNSRENLTMKPVIEALINGRSPTDFNKQETGLVFKTSNQNLFYYGTFRYLRS